MNSYLILNAVKQFGLKYPHFWDNMEMFHGLNGDPELGSWNQLCYAPIAAAISSLTVEGLSVPDATAEAGFGAALAAWRQTKFIYEFDEALADELINQSKDLVIPVDVIFHMPAQAIYIKYPPNGSEVDGFLAALESDPSTGENELRIYLMYKQNPISFAVHLMPGGTINDGIDRAVEVIRQNQTKYQNSRHEYKQFDLSVSFINEMRTELVRMVNLFLYVCSENADIEEDREQSKIYRRPSRIRDRFSEIKKYNAGVKHGILLRKLRTYQPKQFTDISGTPHGTHASPIPHIRRAHYHHFWTGKRDGERTLILRWIPPTLVGGNSLDSPEDIPTTVIKVDKQKGDQTNE